MIGAMIGDIVGSRYEWNNIKTKEFPLLGEGCRFTDDTVMTVALAEAIQNCRKKQISLYDASVAAFQQYGNRYPRAGYGGSFKRWLQSSRPHPYHSYGNGSAMRVSPCIDAAGSLREALDLARESALPTHNHMEGIKGAEAVAAAGFLAKSGKSKDEIRAFVSDCYYNIDFTLDSIRPFYQFDVSCQGSVPQAIIAFLESTSFEDTIRNAVSIGGDSDTIACIAGSIAWQFYGRDGITDEMSRIWAEAKRYLTTDLLQTVEGFAAFCAKRA